MTKLSLEVDHQSADPTNPYFVLAARHYYVIFHGVSAATAGTRGVGVAERMPAL